MGDVRYGWSPVLKVQTIQDVSCSLWDNSFMLHRNKDKGPAGQRHRNQRTPAMSQSHGTFIVLTH